MTSPSPSPPTPAPSPEDAAAAALPTTDEVEPRGLRRRRDDAAALERARGNLARSPSPSPCPRRRTRATETRTPSAPSRRARRRSPLRGRARDGEPARAPGRSARAHGAPPPAPPDDAPRAPQITIHPAGSRAADELIERARWRQTSPDMLKRLSRANRDALGEEPDLAVGLLQGRCAVVEVEDVRGGEALAKHMLDTKATPDEAACRALGFTFLRTTTLVVNRAVPPRQVEAPCSSTARRPPSPRPSTPRAVRRSTAPSLRPSARQRARRGPGRPVLRGHPLRPAAQRAQAGPRPRRVPHVLPPRREVAARRHVQARRRRAALQGVRARTDFRPAARPHARALPRNDGPRPAEPGARGLHLRADAVMSESFGCEVHADKSADKFASRSPGCGTRRRELHRARGRRVRAPRGGAVLPDARRPAPRTLRLDARPQNHQPKGAAAVTARTLGGRREKFRPGGPETSKQASRNGGRRGATTSPRCPPTWRTPRRRAARVVVGAMRAHMGIAPPQAGGPSGAAIFANVSKRLK